MKKTLISVEKKYKTLTEKLPFSEEVSHKFEAILSSQLLESLCRLANTKLSSAEIDNILRTKESVGGKNVAEQHRVLMYLEVIEWLKKSEHSTKDDIREQFLIDLHYLPFISGISDNQLIRYTYKVPYPFTEYIEWLQQQSGHPVEVAIMAVIRMLQVKLFSEGDQVRTALLLVNVLLLQSGYPFVFVKEKDLSAFSEAVLGVVSGKGNTQLIEILSNAVEHSLDIILDEITTPEFDKNRLFKIGQLAKLTNETVATIRYWTKEGLLEVASVSDGGYQLYSPEMSARVLKIRFLQRDKRLKVKEISKALEA